MSRGHYKRGADRETLLSNDDRRFSPGQIQNVKAAKVYVFGNDDIHEEDEEEYELEMSEIRSRRGQSNFARQDKNHTEPTFFQKELGEGDTLQKIALQYACPVSELKRMNNLITDQDFYALRTIKVPLKRYGYLTEIMAEEQKRAAREKANGATVLEEKEPPYDYYTDPESSQDLSDPETQMKVIRTLSIRDNMDSQSREAHQFLRKMDKDLSRMKQKSGDRNSLDEVISVLTNKTFHPLQKKERSGTFDGMSYCKILVIIMTCCIVIPGIIAIVYFLKS